MRVKDLSNANIELRQSSHRRGKLGLFLGDMQWSKVEPASGDTPLSSATIVVSRQ